MGKQRKSIHVETPVNEGRFVGKPRDEGSILISTLVGIVTLAPIFVFRGTLAPVVTSTRMETLALTLTSATAVGTLTWAPTSAFVGILSLAVTTLAFINNNS